VHAGHLPIFKPEHIDPIGTEISTDEKLSGGVKYDRMWMCRRLSLRMDTAADFFDDLSNGANHSVGLEREDIIETTTMNCYDQMFKVGGDRQMFWPCRRERERSPTK
jgi:hypothetical protein